MRFGALLVAIVIIVMVKSSACAQGTPLMPLEISLEGPARIQVGHASLFKLKDVVLKAGGSLRLERGAVSLKLMGKTVNFDYTSQGNVSTWKYRVFYVDGSQGTFQKSARIVGGSLYFDWISVLKAMGYQIEGTGLAYRPMGTYARGTVHFVPANPDEGFYYGYYFYIPSGAVRNTYTLVEPNNIPKKQVPYEAVLASAQGTCSYVASSYGEPLALPVMVPALVGTDDITRITSYYPHALNSVAIQETRPEFKRVDLQLLAMHEDLTKRLRSEGLVLRDQLVLTGFSDSGNFVDRFTLIHPERVKVAVAGGHNLLALPTATWRQVVLNYPSGTADYEAIFGRPFDFAAYQAVHKLHYRSNDDDKDPIYGTNHTPATEKALVLSLFGEWPQRVQRYQAALEVLGVKNLQFNYYEGIGHTIPKPVVADVVRFIGANLGSEFVKTSH